MIITNQAATPEQLQARLDLRRGSRTDRHRDRSKYHRPSARREEKDER